jgi:hypothetical protein
MMTSTRSLRSTLACVAAAVIVTLVGATPPASASGGGLDVVVISPVNLTPGAPALPIDGELPGDARHAVLLVSNDSDALAALTMAATIDAGSDSGAGDVVRLAVSVQNEATPLWDGTVDELSQTPVALGTLGPSESVTVDLVETLPESSPNREMGAQFAADLQFTLASGTAVDAVTIPGVGTGGTQVAGDAIDRPSAAAPNSAEALSRTGVDVLGMIGIAFMLLALGAMVRRLGEWSR